MGKSSWTEIAVVVGKSKGHVMACVRNVVSLVGLFVENFDSIQLTLLMFHHSGITGNALSMKPRYDLGLHYVRLGVYRPAYCVTAHD